MQATSEKYRSEGKKIGFVPTMGFLHEGHLSLIRQMRPLCDILVVSIFVNPTQFAPSEDLEQYPRDFERDEKLCRNENVDIIFYPDSGQMYPAPYATYVHVENLTDTLCGASRPGHFRGVTTIVTKLFHIVKPHLAIFGEKDFQQAVVLKKMVVDLNFDVKIMTGPIIREEDGLAMSSRNKYLTANQRRQATIIYQSLQKAQEMVKAGERNSEVIRKYIIDNINRIPETKIDYVAVVNETTLKPVVQIDHHSVIALAVYIGSTRLIDNVRLNTIR